MLEWKTERGQFQSLQLRMMDFSALSNVPSLQFKHREQQNARQSTLTQSVILQIQSAENRYIKLFKTWKQKSKKKPAQFFEFLGVKLCLF